ncbi:hypothetical protein [Rhodoferax sp.]|uniref:hypothetical protein n=1 Tax=Rhodoferax sp. TaxID=50421 RepID=UPI00284BEDD6|nr:hypothetical protein [Rhodoferax sp.]MDR3371781.1 hypothetical protein [Rhodoferax sp.]
MRAIFGLVSLLIVLAVTGFLVRQQMKAVQAPVPSLQVPATTDDGSAGTPAAITLPASVTPAQQSQQVQQQFKQALDKAMQTRQMPDDQP